MSYLIGIIAGVLAFGSYGFYVRSIIRGETKPQRVSWWVWASLGSVIWASYYLSGARNTLWAPLSEVLGPIAVAILAIKYGEGGWTLFDRKCLIGIGAALILWLVFNSPLVGLVSALAIDFFAALPTVRKSSLRPRRENFTAWLLVVMANFLNIFAIEKWTFALAIQPIYYTAITGIIFLPLLFFRLKSLKITTRSYRRLFDRVF